MTNGTFCQRSLFSGTEPLSRTGSATKTLQSLFLLQDIILVLAARPARRNPILAPRSPCVSMASSTIVQQYPYVSMPSPSKVGYGMVWYGVAWYGLVCINGLPWHLYGPTMHSPGWCWHKGLLSILITVRSKSIFHFTPSILHAYTTIIILVCLSQWALRSMDTTVVEDPPF